MAKPVAASKLYEVLEIWNDGKYLGYFLPHERELAEKYVAEFGGEICKGKRHFIFGKHNQPPYNAANK